MDMDPLRRDLILCFRQLGKSPGFTAAAIVTLALGIGANATIFSLVNAVVFRPFGVERQNELIFFNTHTAKNEFPAVSYPDYKDYRDRNTVLSGLALYRIAPVSMSRGNSKNSRVWGYLASGNYFDMLGVNPLFGRILHPSDDATRNGNPVAVISYNCWRGRFAADPEIAGKKVKLNGLDYTVVGVTPAGFVGTELIYTPEIWVPLSMTQQIENGDLDNRRNQNYFAVGRLKPGVSMKQAEASLNVIAAALGREYPDADAGVSIVLSPPGMAGTMLRGAITSFSAVLMVVAGMVLLIACVNLASLLLARAADRRKETAIRLALGAGRGHLVRQLLTESLVLSIAGGAAGILLAVWLTGLFNAWRPPVDVPVIPQVVIDARVLLFASVVSLVTGLMFGLVPALQSVRTTLAPALKNDAPAERLRRLNLRDILVCSQVALSVALLIGSVLVVRSLQHAMSLRLGFEPRHAAALSYSLDLQGYDEARGRQFQRRLLDNLRAMPGVEAVGLASTLPLTLNISNSSIYLEGKPVPRAGDAPMAAMYGATAGYLRAMQTKLVAGRDFDERDTTDTPTAVLVNGAFAKQLLPGENPLGKRFRHGLEGKWKQIVGVVEDGKYRALQEQPQPAVFQCMEQRYYSDQTVIVRSPLPEAETVRLLRRAVAELDPTLTVFDEGSLTSQLGLALLPARLVAVVLSAFGLLAVVLAATGVYGIVAYGVSRRTREIGIRIALGASSKQVLGTVLARTAILVGVGTTLGLALALAGGGSFEQILFDVSARDPLTYALVIALMATLALLACFVPARRAIGVEPLTALRTE
jgi:predicted permease